MGRTLGVIGESGSGKTTLGRVISGLMPSKAGHVKLSGQELAGALSGRSREELRSIQFAFQMADVALNPRHTVNKILGRPLAFYFDLDKNATPQEARRAYHRMKALYAEGSLATYSLMPADQREEMLDRIERAYMRISRDITSRLPTPESPVSPENAAKPEPPVPGQSIGAYLKNRREDLGLTLRDVANRTRVRTTYLEHIENERLSDLPAPVYLRGFVLEFARVLGLPDPESITATYLELVKEENS